MTNVFDEFSWRGLMYDATDGVADALAKEKVTAYIGVEPACRIAVDGDGVGATAALRPSADCARRWRNRDDRRPQRKIERARAARRRADCDQRRRYPAATGAVSRLRRRPGVGASREQ